MKGCKIGSRTPEGPGGERVPNHTACHAFARPSTPLQLPRIYSSSALQDSLGGNAKTVIVANVHPAAACLRESQSTLAFAQRAKQVVNKAVVNEAAHGELAALTKENARLRRELHLVNDTCRALQQVHN